MQKNNRNLQARKRNNLKVEGNMLKQHHKYCEMSYKQTGKNYSKYQMERLMLVSIGNILFNSLLDFISFAFYKKGKLEYVLS